MGDSPQDVYAKCLPSNRGYPLWFPEPSSTLPSSYKQDGFQIGDVGIASRKGTFDVLFNICYGPNHALHRRPTASFSCRPIALDIDYEVNVISNADPPGCIITSPGITQPGKMLQRAGHYEFTPSSDKGAILILPDGATSHDLLAHERFRKVAMERAFDWYEIAKEHYGDSISSGSLYLITGFYKTRSWSLASFHDATATEHQHIWVVPREGEGTTVGRDWKCTFPVQYRDGPGPGHNGNVNQTVFISGFKIAIRNDVFGWLSQKSEIQPVPAVPPCRGHRCCPSFLMWLFGEENSSKRRRVENGSADVNHVPALSQPFHPSDIINRYLLKKDPDALVAITHDSEWTTLIETGKLMPEELTQEDRLEEFLSENYSLVSKRESSAVYLQGKSMNVSNSVFIDTRGRTLYSGRVQQEMPSKSEGFYYPKPSTDSFQVVITRIRAEDVVAGFKRMPVGFYVLVQFDGRKRRTENKPVCLHDSNVEWDDRIQLWDTLFYLIQLSVRASFELSPMLGKGEVLRTVEICAGDLIDNTHIITFSSTNGKIGSSCSSLLITIERQRSHKSGTASGPDDDFDCEESSYLAQLTDQGHDVLLRWRNDPRKENVTAAVGYFEDALSFCPNDNHHCAAALCNLAMAQFINCRIDRGPMELSTPISHYRKALELRYAGHPDRPGTMLHLAEVLLYHYGKLGCEEFPGEIIRLVSEVQANCSVGSHECRAADLTLQTYALYKAISSGNLADIIKLIPPLRQAVEDIPHDYFDKLQRLANLSLALGIRYEFYGDLGDLDKSITTNKEAMRLTPFGESIHIQFLKEWAKATLAGSSWKDALVVAASFTLPRVTIYRVICERLEAVDPVTDAVECFHEMMSELGGEVYMSGPMTEWVSDFTHRCLSAPGSGGNVPTPHATLNSSTPTPLLREWAKATLERRSWKDALVTAASFVVPRSTIYRVICERLETIHGITHASECFGQMVDELAQAIPGKEAWFLEFKSRCCKALEDLGDTAMNTGDYDEAISQYSAALALDPVTQQGLFIKRIKGYMAWSLWLDALNDANKVIELDPSSPWGYERKHAALHNAGDYDDATAAFTMMLSKIADSPDPEIRNTDAAQFRIAPSPTRSASERCGCQSWKMPISAANPKKSNQRTRLVFEDGKIDVIFVGPTGVGKSSLINMIIGVRDGSEEAAKVSNDARPCTAHTTSYSTLLEAGLRCQLWDTRGLDEVAGTNDGRTMAKMMERIRQLASQQVRELKETLRDRARLARPILVWCIDATRIDDPVHWQQFRKVYVDYCERKAIPVVVITRGPPKATDWETKCTDQLRSLDLGVDVPFRVMRRYRGSSSQEYVEDSKALRDLIAEVVTDNFPGK